MPKVLLEDNDGGVVTGLPRVCVCCGAEATHTRSTTFWWHPDWIAYILVLTLCVGMIFLPIALLLALILHKTKTVELPLCDRHRNPLLAKHVAMWGGLAVLVLLMAVTSLAFALSNIKGAEFLGVVGVALLVLTLGYFPIWLVTAAIVGQRAIHAGSIGDRFIRLVGVSRQFANAIEDQEEDRPRYRDDFDEPRRRHRGEGRDEGYTDRGDRIR
jgi:hypothetical protein